MKKWRLKKDLPCYKAGTIFSGEGTNLTNCDSGVHYSTEFFPEETRSEWLEEVEEKKSEGQNKTGWLPMKGEKYFFVDFQVPYFMGYVSESIWLDTVFDTDTHDAFGVFQTREQAEECAKLCLETRKKYMESLNQE